MTTEFPPIDRDKSPLLDADHDAVRIADALRSSPHITFVAPAAPGDGPLNLNTITALTRTGNEYTLTLAAGYRPVDDQEHATPAADVAYAADRLLTSGPSDAERATAELLN
ncbi:hypothetical protein ACH5AU_31820 [Streptomyces albidoflavus]